jgi:hypothetical protein
MGFHFAAYCANILAGINIVSTVDSHYKNNEHAPLRIEVETELSLQSIAT